jgi:hypothetical protein
LLADLKLQEISGQYKTSTRMAPADFELVINLISPIIAKKYTTYRAAVPVDERQAVTLRATATPACSTFSKFRNKQPAILFQEPTAFADSSQASYLVCNTWDVLDSRAHA